MSVNYGSLPFAEALAFFRAKLGLPTQHWDDLLGAAHDRAFVVAGAMQADLLADLRAAVDRAIADGTTFETFRKDFERIVAERGWIGWTGEDSQGRRAWRARTIYDTNLFTSYSAGRYRQMQEVAERRPYWRYRHSPASVVPRAEHLAWDGMILRHDDPWWGGHSPPNGFNCFPAGTEVATPTGWRAIETLRRGDQVFGGSGNIQTVETPQVRPFDGEIVRVSTEQGEVAATPNHRFLTLRGWIRAENLEVGEMLVQIPQVIRINHSISDIQQPDATSAQFSVARPFHVFQALRSKAFNAHIDLGQENIDPVGEKAAVMNRVKAPFGQFLQKQTLDSRGRSAGVNVGRWVLLMKFPLGINHLGANFRAKCGRTAFEFFSRSACSFVSVLGLPLSGMMTCCRLLQRSFSQNLRGLFSTSVVFGPLDQDALAVVSGFHSKPFHQPHDRSVVAVPPLTKTGDRPSLFSVQDPEGFVSGAPLDQFNSLDEFCGWARAHGVISNVVAIRRQSYTSSVYNLSITDDASYCLRLGVVHNCKCYIETLSERDLKREGLTVTPTADIPHNRTVTKVNPATGEEYTVPEGVDRGWDYAPGANRTTPLYDLIAGKLPSLDAQLGAAMWGHLKDAVAMERQLAWWNTLDEWLVSPQKGRAAMVGAVDLPVLHWLQKEKSIAPRSAAIDIKEGLIRGTKQERHLAAQDGLLESEWRRLPEILAKPEAIYFDTRTGKLVYVVSAGDEAGIKLSVEFDVRVNQSDRTNRVVSGFRQSGKIIDELVRGGLYQPLSR
jgi:hypothetical protein